MKRQMAFSFLLAATTFFSLSGCDKPGIAESPQLKQARERLVEPYPSNLSGRAKCTYTLDFINSFENYVINGASSEKLSSAVLEVMSGITDTGSNADNIFMGVASNFQKNAEKIQSDFFEFGPDYINGSLNELRANVDMFCT